jgi:phosphoserine phosphatase
MTHILTLIGAPGKGQVADALCGHVRRILQEAGAQTNEPDLLAPGDAADLGFANLGPEEALSAITPALEGHLIDPCVVRSQGRRKKLLLADMDSTIITAECIDEIADFIGAKEHVAAITERAMNGEIPFESALRERVSLLQGMPITKLEDVYRERIKLTPGAKQLVQTMNRDGATTALVSGGFTFFTSRVAKNVGFAIHRANQLLSDDGKLTGKVAEPILGRQAKLQALTELRQTHGLSQQDTLVVGDGANDLAMIQQAGLGVAFHAKPVVAAQAQVSINHGDLSSLLYLQGYHRSEFAED